MDPFQYSRVLVDPGMERSRIQNRIQLQDNLNFYLGGEQYSKLDAKKVSYFLLLTYFIAYLYTNKLHSKDAKVSLN